MYSRNHEGKSVVAERFIRFLKNRISKHMNAAAKMCIFMSYTI